MNSSRNSSKDYYLKMKSFLISFSLQPFEGQVILEVCASKQHYICERDLQRKIPKSFGNTAFDLVRILKDLIQKGYLSPYEARKETFCVRSAKFGRDFARQSKLHGFYSFEEFPVLEEKHSKIKLLCYDPQQFNVGDIRYARGPSGRRIEVKITDISSSDEVYGSADDGRTIYCIRLVAQAKCPQCSSGVPIDFTYSPETCYSAYNEFICNTCGFKIMLCCSLMNYYVTRTS